MPAKEQPRWIPLGRFTVRVILYPHVTTLSLQVLGSRLCSNSGVLAAVEEWISPSGSGSGYCDHDQLIASGASGQMSARVPCPHSFGFVMFFSKSGPLLGTEKEREMAILCELQVEQSATERVHRNKFPLHNLLRQRGVTADAVRQELLENKGAVELLSNSGSLPIHDALVMMDKSMSAHSLQIVKLLVKARRYNVMRNASAASRVVLVISHPPRS